MPRRDPVQAIQMLDQLAEFFDNGRRWIKNDFHDGDGNRCLIGAMIHLRAVMNVRGDGTGYYSARRSRNTDTRRSSISTTSANPMPTSGR